MPNNQPLFNYETESEDLRRRQGIVDALRARSMAPLQPTQVGGVGAAPHWSSALANLVSAYMASKGQKEVKADSSALSQRYADELAAGMKRFQTTSEGYDLPATISAPNFQDGVQQPFHVGGDPKKAILEAISSNHPALREFGREAYKRMQDGALTPKDLAGKASAESVLANPGNPSSWKPDLKLQETSPGSVLLNNGRVYTPQAEGASLGEPELPKGPGWGVRTLDGDKFLESATGLKKLDNAAKTSVNVNAPGAEPAFARTFGEAEAKRLSEGLAQRPLMLDSLSAATKGTALLDQGIHTGIFSNVARNLQKADAALFGRDPKKAQRTEEFISYLGDIVIPGLKSFGGSDTEEELRYLQKVSAGDTTLEEPTLRKVLASVEAKTRRKLTELDANAKMAAKAYPNIPTLQNMPAPAVPATAGGSGNSADDPMSLEEARKLYPEVFNGR